MASEKSTDYTSRVLSIAGFLISVTTFYFTMLDKNYSAMFSADGRIAEMRYGTSPGFKLNQQQFSFLNQGSQPVAILNVSYTPMVLGDGLDENCTDSRMRNQEALLAAANMYLGAKPKDFTPFVVKAGELEPRTYAFEVNFSPTAFEPTDPKTKKKYLILCLGISYFTGANGRGEIKSTAARADLDERAQPQWIDIKAIDMDLVKRRWPF